MIFITGCCQKSFQSDNKIKTPRVSVDQMYFSSLDYISIELVQQLKSRLVQKNLQINIIRLYAHTHTHHIGKLVPLPPVGPATPNGQGAANQVPDRVGIPLVVDLASGPSTDPYIDVCNGDESACDLISVFPLIVLTSTWRLMISYSSLVKFREASVTGEVSGSFHASPPRGMTLPFVISHLSHPIEGLFEMQCTHTVCLGEMQCTLPMEQLK